MAGIHHPAIPNTPALDRHLVKQKSCVSIPGTPRPSFGILQMATVTQHNTGSLK